MLVLNEAENTFTYNAIATKPILSVLREFSAPVKIQFNQDNEQLAFLLAHDSDDFNRWESGQKLTERLIWQLLEDYKMQKPLIASKLWIDAHQAILVDQNLSPALKAEILTLPSIAYLLELKKTNDIDGLHVVRTFLKRTLVEKLGASFADAYHLHAMPGLYRYTPTAVANRSLKNLCLSYLMQTEEPIVGLDLCMKQWSSANNMTDSVSVLVAMSNWEGSERQKILAEFYERWQHNPLVLDKWFRIQALSELPNTLDIVKGLMQNASFEITNPNKVYSLIGAFTANLVRFHDQSGEGYTFLADCVIELDPLNPLVAARMVRAFSSWKKFDEGRQDKIRGQLKRILMQDKLSKDVSEVVTKCLAADLI
jgi:aminopeptidase N